MGASALKAVGRHSCTLQAGDRGVNAGAAACEQAVIPVTDTLCRACPLRSDVRFRATARLSLPVKVSGPQTGYPRRIVQRSLQGGSMSTASPALSFPEETGNIEKLAMNSSPQKSSCGDKLRPSPQREENYPWAAK